MRKLIEQDAGIHLHGIERTVIYTVALAFAVALGRSQEVARRRFVGKLLVGDKYLLHLENSRNASSLAMRASLARCVDMPVSQELSRVV